MKDIITKIKYLSHLNSLHYSEVELEFNNYVEKFNAANLYKIKNSKATHIINNMHSVFFYSLYETLSFSEKERKFCGLLNNSFRLIITGADNLLDNDDNHYLGFAKINNSPTMKSVFDILLSEKIIHSVLNDYSLKFKLFSHDKVQCIQEQIFNQLAGSGINEAEESQKLQINLTPEEIINTVHHFKSGKLFTLPFLPAKNISCNPLIEKVENSIYEFGIAIQILDDVSDIIEDYIGKKPNYFIAVLRKKKIFKTLENHLLENEKINLYKNKIILENIDETLEFTAKKINRTFHLLYSLNKNYDFAFFKYILKLLFAKLKINNFFKSFITKIENEKI